MKVYELIDLLKNCDPDSEFRYFYDSDARGEVTHIFMRDNLVIASDEADAADRYDEHRVREAEQREFERNNPGVYRVPPGVSKVMVHTCTGAGKIHRQVIDVKAKKSLSDL